MKLTKRNYFTPKNKYLTASKIKDYLVDPDYFRKLHITHELGKEETASMRLGKAVDVILTSGTSVFKRKYTRAVLKKDDPVLYAENQTTKKTVLTQVEYDKAILMAEAVKMTPAWQITKKAKTQVILTMPSDKMGIWEGLAGMLDYLQIDGETATITDLKTTADAQDYKFQRTCLDYEYYLSMALYSLLVRENFKEVKTVQAKFLVVENDKSAPLVKTFIIKPAFLSAKMDEVIEQALKVSSDTEFIPLNKTINWDEATELPVEYY